MVAVLLYLSLLTPVFATWSLASSALTAPRARRAHAAAWDAVERRCGLWMHYGAASGAPAARAYHGAAYDDVEEAIWIHGGYDGSFYYRDLWQYLTASNTWTLVSSVTGSPSARAYHGMTWAEESRVAWVSWTT
eukprot:g18389.t1